MDSNVSDDNSATQFVDKLLRENDLKGAIDFAKRMQNSFPKLKKLWPFLANIAVQVSSHEEEVDWYTVLAVDPSAEANTVKKHYLQLAKGSSLGSFEAHKLLNKAWGILSDRFTRFNYDLRRKSRELQQNALAVNQESSANEKFSQGFSNINNTIVSNQNSSNNDCNIGGSDQRDDFSDQGEIGEMDWLSFWNAETNYAPDEPLVTFLTACPSCHYESPRGSDQRDDFADQIEISAMDWENFWNAETNYAPDEPLITFLTACPSCHYEAPRVCLISKADCLQCGKAFAALEVPSPDGKHKEWMGLVQDTIKTVPENYMPFGSDGRRDAYLRQMGNSQAKKIVPSKSAKGNEKKRLSDGERNISRKKTRNMILNQELEWNAAAMDYNEHNAADNIENAATEGPKEDASKTTEVLPDSEFQGFDQDRTQESSVENQLWEIYREIMEFYKNLL